MKALPQIRSLCLAWVALFVLMGLPERAPAQRLDDSWTVTVNGQTVLVNSDGSFHLPNISAPDDFGVDGPGSTRDFVGDDLVRLIAHSNKGGTNRYAYSEYFRIRQGETNIISAIFFTNMPPPVPESITLALTNRTAVIGANFPLTVLARFGNGTVHNVTPSIAGTSYRVSNPNIATVLSDGVVLGRLPGIVFVTAVNEGATAVARLNVVPPDVILTSVRGTVLDTNGSPASGVAITLRSGELDFSAVTADDGSFIVNGVPTTSGVAALTAIQQTASGRLVAVLGDVALASSGNTFVGNLTLMPFQPRTQEDFVAAEGHTVALKDDGSLWAWGNNGNGQLGNGTFVGTAVPARIGIETNWQAIACLFHHTVARRTDGTLWAWGENGSGQLGIGPGFFRVLNPTQVGTNTNWLSAAAGSSHTVAIQSDGSLWAWGNNCCGQLGDGTAVDADTPRRIGTETNWWRVFSGISHNVALKTDGSLWAWGDNGSGQLGIRSTIFRTNTPVRVGTNTNWVSIACGYSYTMALTSDGRLWAWGENSEGALGIGTLRNTNAPTAVGTNTDWAFIAAGNHVTAALKLDGSLWVWGYNGYGQLANGTFRRTNAPIRMGAATGWQAVKAGAGHIAALRTGGELWTWGDNQWNQSGNGTLRTVNTPMPMGNETNWSLFTCSYTHTLALKTDGSLWGWGQNDFAHLGDGTSIHRAVPTRVGTNTWRTLAPGATQHSMAVQSDGSLWGWGGNSSGQLGIGASTFFTNRPARAGIEVAWEAIACGWSHSVGLKTNGSLWAWGNGSVGQLGMGALNNTNAPAQVGTASDWVAVASGQFHTMGIKTDGSLWIWGDNNCGKLGNGTFERTNVPTRIGLETNWRAVAGGDNHTLALKTDGSLWVWGCDRAIDLTNAPAQIGSQTDWRAIAAGSAHNAAVKTDGTLWAWGFNGYGQVGNGTFEDVLTPTQIGADTNWIAVSCGNRHTIARKADGRLFSWGDNEYGQIAQPVSWLPHQVLGPAGWGLP